MGRNILKSSLENASFSIIFQILFRCITFILNAYIIRTVGQEVLGIMNVRLLLLESTIIFLSKEPILKACLTDTKSHNWAQVINQIWLSVPICSVISFGLVYVWINVLIPTDDIYLSQYKLGCYAIALSCIVEQSTQSVVLIAQSFSFVKLKVTIETIYVVTRTIIFVYLVQKYPNQAIDAFSFAQIFSSIILCFMYYGFFLWYISNLNTKKQFHSKEKKELDRKTMFSDMEDFPFTSVLEFLPGFMSNKESHLNRDLCVLSISFLKQSVIKQILTEGERYVMTISPVMTFSEQSVYDIVNNLGSLAARFIFRPIEESAYFYFTQMIKRGGLLSKQNQKEIAESASVLGQLCKVVVSIGLFVVIFGQAYSYTFLFIYGGHKLTETTLPITLLRFHSFAVVLLAINGVTEGYVFATMTNEQLNRYNYIMVFFSISFLLTSYCLTFVLGPVGFILANCLNMLARICHSVIYISKKYQDTKYRPLRELYPGSMFVITLVMSLFITKFSEAYILEISIILHLTVGALCILLSLLVWANENKTLLQLGYERYKRRSSVKNE